MSAGNRVAVVTGARQGIGKRTAELLAERGYALAIFDTQDSAAMAMAIEVAGGDGSWESLRLRKR